MTADGTRRPQTEAVLQEVASEREQLANAVDELRQSAALKNQLGTRLPLVLAGAFGTGFVLSGGIGATVRLLFRRGREGRTAARGGRYALVRR